MLQARTIVAASVFLVAIASCSSTPFTDTPLDAYIAKPDSTYKYEDTGYKVELESYTAYFINMTSQTWLTGPLLHITAASQTLESLK